MWLRTSCWGVYCRRVGCQIGNPGFYEKCRLSHVEECFLTRRLLSTQNLNAWRNYETNTDLVRGRGGVTGRFVTAGSFSRATWISAAWRAGGDSRAQPRLVRRLSIIRGLRRPSVTWRKPGGSLRLPRQNSMGTGLRPYRTWTTRWRSATRRLRQACRFYTPRPAFRFSRDLVIFS